MKAKVLDQNILSTILVRLIIDFLLPYGLYI